MQKRLKYFKNQKGTYLMIMAFAVIIALAFCGIVVDAGRMILTRQNARIAADAAALAGAANLGNTNTATEIAYTYAGMNGFTNEVNNTYVYVSTGVGDSWQSQEVEVPENPPSEMTDEPTGVGEYAIFAYRSDPSLQHTLEITGARTNITGNIHSNAEIKKTGANSNLDGIAEYVTTYQCGGSVDWTFQESHIMDWPRTYNINDYRPGGKWAQYAEAEGKYHHITGNWTKNDDSPLDGLYYVEGEFIHANAKSISGTYTIVAEGEIHFNGKSTGVSTPYCDDLLIFCNASDSSNWECKINGNSYNLEGVIYCPNADIDLNGTNNTITGAVLGNTVDVSGSDFTVNYAPGLDVNDSILDDDSTPDSEGEGYDTDAEISADWIRVTIRRRVAFFFMPLLGINDTFVTVYATARTTSQMPISICADDEYGLPDVQNLEISGPYAYYSYGDPYATKYLNNGEPNPEYNPNGYDYFIYVPDNYQEINGTSMICIEIFDPETYSSYDEVYSRNPMLPGQTQQTAVTHFTLYTPADTPSQWDNQTIIAQATYEGDSSTNEQWVIPNGFTFDTAVYGTGYYRLNVKTTDGACGNSYNLRAGPPPPPAPSPSGTYTLKWYAYDWDTTNDVTVTVNGNIVDWEGLQGQTGNRGYKTYNIDITSFVDSYPITIRFKDNNGGYDKHKNVRLYHNGSLVESWQSSWFSTGDISYQWTESAPGGSFNPNNGTKIKALGNLEIWFKKSGTVNFKLGYIPPQAAGLNLHINKFDTDVGAKSITYYDDLGNSWAGQLSSNGTWKEDIITIPENYPGSYIYAQYQAGYNDTSVWNLWFEGSVPGIPGKPRLVE